MDPLVRIALVEGSTQSLLDPLVRFSAYLPRSMEMGFVYFRDSIMRRWISDGSVGLRTAHAIPACSCLCAQGDAGIDQRTSRPLSKW